MIKVTVKSICQEGGLVGNFTNNSLKAMFASHRFDQNVPEQIIKEITGHCSDCIGVYKRMSDHLKENASKVLRGDNVTKKVKVDIEDEVENDKPDGDNVQSVKGTLSYSQMIKNILKT